MFFVKYTGLRPGEKLYEELLMNEEGMQDTDNKLINIGRPIEFDKEHFYEKLEELKEMAYAEDSADKKEDYGGCGYVSSAEFVISIMASIVAYYICKWLDGDY